MKQQVYLSKSVNTRLVWVLILLLSLLLSIPLSQSSLFQVGDETQTCGEHCIDVGSFDWQREQTLSNAGSTGGNSPTEDCGEHCIDVGSLEETPNKKLNRQNL